MNEDDEIICERCQCKGGTEELHACPYRMDIYVDDTEDCNCCENCQQNCAEDI